MLAPGVLECLRVGEDRDPSVGDLGRQLDRLAADRTEEDRDVAADRVEVELQRLALAVGQGQLVVRAVVGDRALAGDDLAHDFHVLARAPPGLRVGDAVPALRDLRPRGTEAEDEAAARERVDRAAGHRRGGRRPRGHLHDRGAEVDGAGLSGQPRRHRHDVGSIRFRHPDRLEPQPLGVADEIQRLPPPRADAPVADTHTELHGATLSRPAGRGSAGAHTRARGDRAACRGCVCGRGFGAQKLPITIG